MTDCKTYPPNDDGLGDLFSKPAPPPPRRMKNLALGVAALAAIAVAAYLVWQWASSIASVQRKPPELTTIIPLPPPPAPPPKPETPPPPDKKMVEPEPVPVPSEAPKPAEEAPPKPADTTADPMQMNADAQSGSDAFNIGAGTGHGLAGSGGGGRIGNATYGQYLGYALQKTLRETDSTRLLVYRMNVDLWISREGQVTRVEMAQSSGDKDIDEKVLAVLRRTVFDQRPTTSTTMPVKVALTSRRPS
ncbi:energy transducer TonB [Chromobacterium sp. IIBBL 290-4]|uniref:energy transducer TonB family protein n=1 Tax=Chromobacterium sp. IIBBL 290-4 TaxID=2953890 RepID=UPI0020B71EDE|nr:energy transducer TonB [Chromobacterium sp. IIBBL 290-4]UTH74481.1 TonB family protein [Chromobacterium sp. IIBBL 290-4]